MPTTPAALDLTRQARLGEIIRRLDEDLATFNAREEYLLGQIRRLDAEVTDLAESVESVQSGPDGGALVRHDVRQRVIDGQLAPEVHVHDLAQLRREIAEAVAVRDDAADELETLTGEQ